MTAASSICRMRLSCPRRQIEKPWPLRPPCSRIPDLDHDTMLSVFNRSASVQSFLHGQPQRSEEIQWCLTATTAWCRHYGLPYDLSSQMVSSLTTSYTPKYLAGLCPLT